ncbi:MAG TPA: multidrug effflux MFS transporter [Bauldia sp.]|nr:multidrug effflux MFS transporter [Bauldia sp.]
MKSSFARNAIVLGLLTAVGPFAIDMYLPALPAIANDFHVSPAAAQGSILAFFLAIALGQIVYGPISDSYGRKRPLYFGLALYVVGTIACSLAPSIEWLIAARFIQGIGACAGGTIPSAIVRDLHTGHEAARLMSLIMLVFSVSPMLAPLTGSLVVQFGTWREIFLIIAVLGLASLAVGIFWLRETRPPGQRVPFHAGEIARNYLALFRDRHYLGVVFIGAFGVSSFFAYLAGSSFIYIDHFGLTPTQFSFAFSINAIAFIGMAQFAGYFGKRFGLPLVINVALAFYLLVTLILLVLILLGVDNVFVFIGFLFVAFGSMGLVIPSTAPLALQEYGETAGTASALMGTLQLVVAAVVIGIVSAFSGALPMVVAMVACAVVAFALGRLTLGGQRATKPATAAAPAE